MVECSKCGTALNYSAREVASGYCDCCGHKHYRAVAERAISLATEITKTLRAAVERLAAPKL